MRFTANRLLLLEAVKTVLKIVSKNKDIAEISGILIEADADSGVLSLTGTDIRTHIQRRLNQEHIEESGSMILKPVLAEMLRLLEGEAVTFQSDRQLIQISSGNACYTIPFLVAKAFPKLQIPFPDDTICVNGINGLIRRTVFAAADNNTADQTKIPMQYIKLSFNDGNTKAEATNGSCGAVSLSPHCADGRLEMIIHQKALQVLNGIIKPDDEMFVGITGNFAVFMKEDLFFSTMIYSGQYFESSKLFGSIKPVYKATTDAKALYELAGYVSAILYPEDDHCVNLRIGTDKISMQSVTAIGSSQSETTAADAIPTPNEGFHYNPKYLLSCLQCLSGPLNILIDDRGFMILEANQSQYFVCPRGPVHIRKPEKEEKQKKRTTTKTSKAKAA